MIGNLFKGSEKYAPIPLRIIIGIGFILHGLSKFTGGLDKFQGFLTSLNVPAAGFFATLVAIVELLGGIFILAGFMTRYAAIGIGIVMVFAIILAKAKAGFLGGYELDMLYLAGAISLLITGGGAISVDNLFHREN
ncbi:MAG: DoxX family protein [Nanoarchaeota archaeon]